MSESTSSSPAESKKDKTWQHYAIAVLVLFVIIVWFLNLDHALNSLSGEDAKIYELGTLGDAFGIANSLFSGLAFLGLLYAVKLQRDELHEVKEERKAVVKQFEQQERQAEIRHKAEIAKYEEQLANSKKQELRRENDARFFQLLSLYRENYNSASADKFRGPKGWDQLAKALIGASENSDIYHTTGQFIWGTHRTLKVALDQLNASSTSGVHSSEEINNYHVIIMAQLTIWDALIFWKYEKNIGSNSSVKIFIKEYFIINERTEKFFEDQ